VRNLVAGCVAAFGRIDGAFNNAGVMRHTRPLLEIGLHEFQDMMQANAFSALCCMNEEIRQMRKQEEAASVETKSASPVARSGRYSIVNCSSINAERPFTTTGLYGSTKVAIDFLTKTAALEQADVPIRINSVQPGPVATDIFGDLSSIDPTGTLTSRVAIAEFGKRHTLFGPLLILTLTLFSYLFILLFILFYLSPMRRTSGRTTRSGRAGGVPAERCSIVHHRREPARGWRRCRSHHRRIQPLTRPQRSVATNEWRCQDRMGGRKGNAAKGNGKRGRERERWAAFAIQRERRKGFLLRFVS
jgi:NAD(P)-dependent dehydrogenase (short-subunit alcohol dehydrogenase family)